MLVGVEIWGNFTAFFLKTMNKMKIRKPNFGNYLFTVILGCFENFIKIHGHVLEILSKMSVWVTIWGNFTNFYPKTRTLNDDPKKRCCENFIKVYVPVFQIWPKMPVGIKN